MRSCLFLCLLMGTLSAAEPIPKSDGPAKKSQFQFPTVNPKTLPPVPVPVPGAVPLLTADTLYVIPADESFLLFDSPRGLVKITRETGPIRIRGKFLDGDGKVETRTYNQKNLAIVEATGAKGRVELIAVPAGLNDEAGASRMLLDLNQAPQPPPVDPVDPVKPDPIKPPFSLKSFRVLIITPGTALTGAENSVIYGKEVEQFLEANCTKGPNGERGWARTDKDALGNYEKDRQAVWDAVKADFQPPKNTKTPAIAIQVNDKITIEKLAATPAAQVAILKQRMEGN